MKIEIGESLMYSWIRHVKGCQIAQNNWKVSSLWVLQNQADLQTIMDRTKECFQNTPYDLFKKNLLNQFIAQGECDAIGISYDQGGVKIYAVDIAFHRNGVNYGSKEKTIAKILEKCVRTAMCIYGYFNIKDAEIIFAAPNMRKRIENDLKSGIAALQNVTKSLGYHFRFCIYANDDFKDNILEPVLLVSDRVDDTAELFLRSYQLLELFNYTPTIFAVKSANRSAKRVPPIVAGVNKKAYAQLKIGRLAQTVFAGLLEAGKASSQEIASMMQKTYSKQVFDLQYPVLVKEGMTFDRNRYYTKPLEIASVKYYLCSQWFETPANNDRPYLEKWIDTHI